MNNDLVDNPFDEEYKVFVKDFGCLLAEIIKTIDQHGLQKKYLATHKDKVLIFLESLQSSKTNSLILKQYQTRFRKNQNKLFTFLDYDGVPWNNNAAENAVKCFAIHRKERHGGFKESDIRRFLILLSIYQTCKYREINFLEFLRSKETDISAFKG